MNNTSEVVTLNVNFALNWVAPVKNGWILKGPKAQFMKKQLWGLPVLPPIITVERLTY